SQRERASASVKWFRPARRTSAIVKPFRIARNVWVLRRELLALVLRRRPKPPKPLNDSPLTCLRCGRTLDRACKPNRLAHVFVWPEGAGVVTIDGERVEPGRRVYVRRQKPSSSGRLRP